MTQTDISKFLSFVLRHDPGSIHLDLDAGGWALISDLVRCAEGKVSAAQIHQIAAASDKQRFAISPDGTRIRANQGHSFAVDLGLAPQTPPDQLFHGTAQANLDAILSEGLTRQSRQHVHLSPDPETARRVGQRHGKPVVLRVDSAGLHAAGHSFLLSANGVWLTGSVPPQFLVVLP